MVVTWSGLTQSTSTAELESHVHRRKSFWLAPGSHVRTTVRTDWRGLLYPQTPKLPVECSCIFFVSNRRSVDRLQSRCRSAGSTVVYQVRDIVTRPPRQGKRREFFFFWSQAGQASEWLSRGSSQSDRVGSEDQKTDDWRKERVGRLCGSDTQLKVCPPTYWRWLAQISAIQKIVPTSTRIERSRSGCLAGRARKLSELRVRFRLASFFPGQLSDVEHSRWGSRKERRSRGHIAQTGRHRPADLFKKEFAFASPVADQIFITRWVNDRCLGKFTVNQDWVRTTKSFSQSNKHRFFMLSMWVIVV